MELPTHEEVIQRCHTFLQSIGIEMVFTSLDEPTFLPGLCIREGKLLVDREKLLYPGDILHEAGHIAVVEEKYRSQLNDNVNDMPGYMDGNELVAILWSYAALKAIGFPEEVVFHPDGYKGASDWFIEHLQSGNYIALPLLQWMGMALDEKNAAEQGVEPFPKMISWLRQNSVISTP